MRGRPITTDELERILTVTAQVVGDHAALGWTVCLRAFWAS
ncbi:MAG: hypothetical protein AAF961_07590 [Planctomycetota bacterium]